MTTRTDSIAEIVAKPAGAEPRRPDGSLFVTEDGRGTISRIAYQGNQS
jgi:hypothetical protein